VPRTRLRSTLALLLRLHGCVPTPQAVAR
jgi:hypothetical protein